MKKVHEISKNWVCELKERKELYELVSKKLEELNFYEDAYKIQVSLLETKGEEGNVQLAKECVLNAIRAPEML